MGFESHSIQVVRSEEDLAIIRDLFKSYTEWLNLDLSFQDYASEFASLPGNYSPPTGELLLAKGIDGRALGCAALRPLPGSDGRCCELKRLYTLPSARGLGLGRALVVELLSVAVRLGYVECKLDTLPRMATAIKLYASVGFQECEAYYSTPLEETVFLSCDLRNWKRD